MRFFHLAIILAIVALGAMSACIRKNIRVMKKPEPEWLASGTFKSLEKEPDRIILQYSNLKAGISILKDGTVFIESAWSNQLPPYTSYAVETTPELSALTLEETEEWIHISTAQTRVEILKSAFEARIYTGESLVHRFQVFKEADKEKLYIYAPSEKERFFGLGEKTGDFELTGRSFTMYNKDTYKYTTETDPVYAAIPFYHVLSRQGQYGVFIDNPGKMKLELNDPRHEVTIYDYYARIYIFTGSSKEIITKYSHLTGMPFLPPLYGFGFHQSRYSYTNQAQVLEIAQGFRDNGLPLDVLYLDIGFMSNHMSFTYEPRSFPDPRQMHRQLKAMGIRTVAIVDPGIKVEPRYDVYSQGLKKGVFVTYKGKPYKGAVWPGMCHFPDFTKEGTSEWWGIYYKRLLDLGISGFWNDMNEPSVFSGPNGTLPPKVIQDNQGHPRPHKYLHNAYGLTMIRSTYTEVQKHTPSERVFLLTRSGYAGMQKYAMIWTGDNTALWDHIRMNVSMAMNLGLSGVPYSGADIGGYSGTPRRELFTRWIQLGTFIPFMRDHTEKGTRFQEPYRFEKNLPVIRKYMRLRYSLLPYLYTQAWMAHTQGQPVIRPLWLDFGRDYLDIDEQFMFGPDIMVAPALYPAKKVSHINITLPSQTGWTEWWTGRSVSGNISRENTLEDIPLFQREGSIIPLFVKDYRSTLDIQKEKDAPIALMIRPDNEGKATGRIYEDDYHSMDYKKGTYRLLHIDYSQQADIAQISIDSEGSYKVRREYHITLPPGITRLRFNDKDLQVSGDQAIIIY